MGFNLALKGLNKFYLKKEVRVTPNQRYLISQAKVILWKYRNELH